jgi:plasmid maintenance system antidote protein VapI
MEGKIAGPNYLLDVLLQRHELKNDAALAVALAVAPPVISKVRHGRQALTPTFILNIHETFAMSVEEVRLLGAAPRVKAGQP